MKQTYQEIGATKSAALLSSIPQAWVVPPELVPSTKVLDVSSFPTESGWFTPEELEITSSDPLVILDKIRTKVWSSGAVTRAFCKRAAAAHQLTNCLSATMFPEALATADDLDSHLARTGQTIGSLHGLPISLKDNFHVKGHDSTVGLVARAHQPDQDDSTLVGILRRLGAVVYVKTNVPTAMLSADTVNNVFGRTLNPLGRHMSVGGSSGGEAGLLAFMGSPLGVGTDIGGSLRIPAAACGIFSLKPTLGRFPTGRCTPSLQGQESLNAVNGPMARSIAALRLFAKSVVDTQPWLRDPKALPIPWRQVELPPKLKIGVIWDDGRVTPTPPVQRALKSTVEMLRQAGHDVIEWKAEHHAQAESLAYRFLSADGGKTVRQYLDAVNEPLPHGMEHWETVAELGTYELWQFHNQRNLIAQAEVDRWADAGIDCLLSPTNAFSVFEHDKFKHAAYTCTWNVLDYSAVSFPTHVTADKQVDVYPKEFRPLTEVDGQIRDDYNAEAAHGLPISLQVIARRLEEEKVLAMTEIILAAIGSRNQKRPRSPPAQQPREGRSPSREETEDHRNQDRPPTGPVVKYTQDWLTPSRDLENGHFGNKKPPRLNTYSLLIQPAFSVPDQPFLYSPVTESLMHQEVSYASIVQQGAVIRLDDLDDDSNPSVTVPSPASSRTSALRGAGDDVGNRPTTLPAFVRPLPEPMASEDLEFLRQKGALVIPDLPLRRALISAYLRYFHPLMPFLDLSLLTSALKTDLSPSDPAISILLLQAVFFAGSTGCSVEELAKEGYETRRKARRIFYERTRRLYEFDVEKDRLVVAQAVLLMTFWSKSANDEKGGWHWMGVTVTLAQGLCLHRQHPEKMIPQREHRLRRRLWWSCHMRDMMFVLGMSRPPKIRNDGFDTLPLNEADFDYPLDAVTDLMALCGLNPDIQKVMVGVSILLAELSVLVRDVFSLQFTPLQSRPSPQVSSGLDVTSFPLIFPDFHPQKTPLVWELDDKIQAWFQQRPSFWQYLRGATEESTAREVLLFRGYLHLTSFAMISALHRPQVLSGHRGPPSGASPDPELRSRSMTRIHEALTEVATVIEDLDSLRILAFGQSAILMYTLPTSLFFLGKLLRSADESCKSEAARRFCHCLQGMETLREAFVGGDIPCGILQHMMRKAQVSAIQGPDARLQGVALGGQKYFLDQGSRTEDSFLSRTDIKHPSGGDEWCMWRSAEKNSDQNDNHGVVAQEMTTCDGNDVFEMGWYQDDGSSWDEQFLDFDQLPLDLAWPTFDIRHRTPRAKFNFISL